MQPQHDVFCDEQHLPRQQCNTALAPAVLRAARPIERDPVETAAIDKLEPDEEPASSAVRDAVAMAETPEPTVYVSREWERTSAAVGHRDAAAIDADKRSSRGGARQIAMAVVAIAVVFITVRGVRGRRGERI